jgi:hypothetical protein
MIVPNRPDLPTIEDLCRYLAHLEREADTVALLIVRKRADEPPQKPALKPGAPVKSTTK